MTLNKAARAAIHQPVESLYELITAIVERATFDHMINKFEVIETHISYVLLTGPYAYKFKKPVNLGFLDFSTLEKRKFYCLKELQLNRRLAPHIYVDVIPITGSYASPIVGGEGTALEYALKMIQFNRSLEFDRLAKNNKLTVEHINDLAKLLVKFHTNTAVAKQDTPYGSFQETQQSALENFSQIKSLLNNNDRYHHKLNSLENWTHRQSEKLQEIFIQRKQHGYIRECHGDMHMGNITLHKNEILIFDCIEFSENLRWIDVINDFAFLIMDLDVLEKPNLANQLLNTYMELCGEYDGLSVLCFYLVYRAMVRAKIACIRAQQTTTTAHKREELSFHQHIDLACRYINPSKPAIIITHGLSGSGKTTLTQLLLETPGFIRIRSDVERKRLFNLAATAKSGFRAGAGYYTHSANVQVYKHLSNLTEKIIQAGYSSVVDATFLHFEQRETFRKLAKRYALPLIILNVTADKKTLYQRLEARNKLNKDASEADTEILNYQLDHIEPIRKAEYEDTIDIHMQDAGDSQSLLEQVQSRMCD